MTTTNNPMTPEAIVRVIAERDGKKPVFDFRGNYVGAPNYLSSRDALFPVIGKLSRNEKLLLAEVIMTGPIWTWPEAFLSMFTLPPETLAPLVARAIVESKNL